MRVSINDRKLSKTVCKAVPFDLVTTVKGYCRFMPFFNFSKKVWLEAQELVL